MKIKKYIGILFYWIAVYLWKIEVKFQALSIILLKRDASLVECKFISYNSKKTVEINSVEDVKKLDGVTQYSGVLLLDVNKIFWGYGYYFPVHNPYIMELKYPGFLDFFYKNYQPSSVYDAWFPRYVDSEIPKDVFVDRRIPWLPWNAGEGYLPSNGLAGTEFTQGVALRGPVSRQKLYREKFRIHSLFERIKSEGYRPDLHGHINGQFFVDGQSWSFVCCGGNHRLAVLAALGHKKIPVVGNFQLDGGLIIDPPKLRNDEERFIFSAIFSQIGAYHRRELIERCFDVYCQENSDSNLTRRFNSKISVDNGHTKI